MIISVVERQTWKRCRRRWDLTAETRQSLALLGIIPALQLGAMIQECLSIWQEKPEKDPLGIFKEISIVSLAKYKERYLERVGAPISDEELDPMYVLIELGLAMVENYKTNYGKPLPKDFKLIQTEQRIMVAIPDTMHWECDECHWVLNEYSSIHMNPSWIMSPKWSMNTEQINECPQCHAQAVKWQPHYLRGTLDSLLQDSKGKVYCLERKTYGQRPSPEKLTHDDQMLAYLWILSFLFGIENVGGVLYDGLWKRAKPPAKRGGVQLELADLFYRDIFPRPPEEIKEFEKNLKDEVEDMVEAVQKNRFFLNRTWQGCWDCDMQKLCSAMSRGEDVDYVKETFYTKREYGAILPEEDD